MIVDFGDQYRDFIKDIYFYNHEFEGIPIMKAGSLIDRYDSNDIMIVQMDINVSGFVYFNKVKGFMYKEIAGIKTDIRRHFKPRITDYAYDNIFHLTVDMDEFLYTKSVCDRYIGGIMNLGEGRKNGKCKMLSRQHNDKKNV